MDVIMCRSHRRAINTRQRALHPPSPPSGSPTGHKKNSPFNASSLSYKYTSLGVCVCVCGGSDISKGDTHVHMVRTGKHGIT